MIFKFGDVSGTRVWKKMTQSKLLIKNSKLFYMYVTLLLYPRWYGPPEVDLN